MTETKKSDLEWLLKHMVTGEGRYKVISDAVFSGSKVNPELVKWAVAYAEKNECTGDAGYLADEAGLLDLAMQVYEKGGLFDDAGRVALEAKKYEKAVQLLEKAKSFSAAAEAAEKIGMIDKAMEL